MKVVTQKVYLISCRVLATGGVMFSRIPGNQTSASAGLENDSDSELGFCSDHQKLVFMN